MPLLQTRVTQEEENKYKTYARMNGVSVSELIRRSLENEVSGSRSTIEFGCKKGDIVIANDFNSSLEDLEEAFYGE